MYGADSMPETGENVAHDCGMERMAQDAFAWRSQMRTARALKDGFFAEEIVPVEMQIRKALRSCRATSIHGPIQRPRSLLQLRANFSGGNSYCRQRFGGQ